MDVAYWCAQTWRCWEFQSVFAKHSRSFSFIDSLAVGVDRMQRNFGPMQEKGSMRKKGTKSLQIAEKFGAHIAIAQSAIGLESNLPPYTVELEGGRSVRGQTVIIAAGSRYS